MKRVTGLIVVVVVAGIAGGGCADARITGSLGDRTVRATGTVAAWLDSTVFVDQGDGSATREDRSTDASALHIELFEPVFDPSVDFGELSGSERAALLDDIGRGDHVGVVVRRGEALRAGDEIGTLPKEGLPPEVLPFVDGIVIDLRERPADGSAYPDDVARAGSDVSAEFVVDETAPVLSGTLTLEVDADEDEDQALEGKLVIEFTTELLPERIAECNFDRFGQGAIDACTLAPRVAGSIGGGGSLPPREGEGEGE